MLLYLVHVFRAVWSGWVSLSCVANTLCCSVNLWLHFMILRVLNSRFSSRLTSFHLVRIQLPLVTSLGYYLIKSSYQHIHQTSNKRTILIILSFRLKNFQYAKKKESQNGLHNFFLLHYWIACGPHAHCLIFTFICTCFMLVNMKSRATHSLFFLHCWLKTNIRIYFFSSSWDMSEN